jgi:hypothetical protein
MAIKNSNKQEIGEEQNNNALLALIDYGSELFGAAIAGIIGFFAGGPVGAAIFGAAGAGVAKVIKSVGEEISQRHLSKREKIRSGGVLIIVADEISKRVQAGHKLRNDDFFIDSDGMKAEQVFESVISKAQREPEERKLTYMAKLMANIAFDNNVTWEMAHFLIKAAEQLTYRQLCLINIARNNSENKLRNEDYRTQKPSIDTVEVLYECFGLQSHEFISFGDKHFVFGLSDIIPNDMHTHGFGNALYELMGLSDMPQSDVDNVIDLLR